MSPRLLSRPLDGGRCEWGYAERDRRLAETFILGAGKAGVARVDYLTGVVPGGDSSEHLDSRREVEEVLAGGDPELVSLRASMIVGAESDSFRTLAQIVERLPVLALPRWRDTRTQPVGIEDVVAALLAAEHLPAGSYTLSQGAWRRTRRDSAALQEAADRELERLELPARGV